MARQFHIGTLISGLVLAAWGFALLGDGMGWWNLELVDLRYAGPVLIIAIGVVVVIGAMSATRRRDQRT